tara:strand:+ start:6153 stop:7631 length:1479 start_codon:yes stop_codon:yes gene_type:complete
MELQKEIEQWLAKLLLVLKVDPRATGESEGLTWANAVKLYKQNMSPQKAASAILTMTEAFKIGGVRVRPFGDQELRDYLVRIRDNAADPKKKSDWNTDKTKLPHFHNSSIGDIIGPDGDDSQKGFKGVLVDGGSEINVEKLKKILSTRPPKILGSNAKAEHSNEMVFMIGLPALKGMAVDEETNELFIVDTCPGAGTCKLVCYAMGGSYIIVKGKTLRYHRLLTWLLNDPEGFKNQIISEVRKEKAKADKGEYELVIRWHDSGDFFSPDYMQIAIDIANELPDVLFAAYTKVSGAVNANVPNNLIMNFSMGAKPNEVDQVDLEKTKLSVIVPLHIYKKHIGRVIEYNGTKIKLDSVNGRITSKGGEQRERAYEVIAKKENMTLKKAKATYRVIWDYLSSDDWHQVQKNLANAMKTHSLDVKSNNQMIPKQVLSKYKFDMSTDSIITWEDMISKPRSSSPEDSLKWNVVVLPNTDGDDAAQRKDVWISFLLIH